MATLVLLIIIGSRAQDCRTVLIMNADPQLCDVKTIVSGAGKELDANALQQQLNAGYRIIDAAYTSNGWIVALSKKSGIKNQIFKYEADLDDKWIDQETTKGKVCSVIACSSDKCLTVMSEDPNIFDYHVEAGYFDDMCDAFDKIVDKGYIITSAHPVEDAWIWTIGKSTKCKGQNAMVMRFNDLPNFLEYQDEYSGKMFFHHILCCGDFAVLFYGAEDLNGSKAKQDIVINPANPASTVAAKKQSGYYLSRVSGTVGCPYASDANGNPTEGRLMTASANTAGYSAGVLGGLFKERDAEFYEAKKCSKCGGNGKCTYCYGTGHTPGDEEERCHHCYGTGECNECNGGGETKAGFGDDLVANVAEMLPGLLMAQRQIDKDKANRARKGLKAPLRWEVKIIPSKKTVEQIQGDNPMQVFEGLQNLFK